jgi:hypothetical protein
MNVARDITVMVNRLHIAGISTDHLCYELDTEEWRNLAEHIESNAPYQDLSYAEDTTYMGLHVRKRMKGLR